MPDSGNLGNLSLAKVMFLGCKLECKVPEETNEGLCLFTSSPLPFTLPVKSQPLQKCCAEGDVLGSWSDSKEGGWKWKPHHQEMWRQGDFQSSFSPECPSFLGCHRLGVAGGGSAWIWRLWSHPEETRHSRYKGGSLAGTSPLAPSTPRQSSLGTQACSSSRDVTPAQAAEA